jgi:hypothetical protein
MLDRESFYAVACVLSGFAVALGTFIALGGGPGPVISFSMIVIGLGAALVVIRYGRLGPYQGEFGPPPIETVIRDRIVRETERCNRYGGEYSILALRQKSRRSRNVAAKLRLIDEVIHCRKGVTLLMLPETGRAGALRTYERISVTLAEPAIAALVSYPADGTTSDEIASRLRALVRADAAPGDVIVFDRERDQVATLAV